MNSVEIAKLSRESKHTILRGMIAENYPMGIDPVFTARRILDKEFTPEVLWMWYEDMAKFSNR